MIRELTAETQKIQHVFDLADDLPYEEEILSHWARYLCVLTAGLIETTTRLLFGQYARIHSSPEAANFVVHQMKYQTNLNTEKLRQLLGAFSDKWQRDFDQAITDEQKDAIDSVIANKNNIAHGRPVGISLVRVKEYHAKVAEVINWVSREVLRV